MPSTDQLRASLVEIDRQINEIVAANPISKAGPRHIPFPILWIAIALVVAALWQFGPQMLGDVITPDNAKYLEWATYGAGGLAVLMLLRWMVFSRSKTRKSYHTANEKLKELRKQRAMVEAELKG